MSLLVASPVLLPLLTALAGFLGPRTATAQRAIALAGTAGLAAAALALAAVVDASGPRTLQLGAWPAPFGVTWVADRLGSLMTVVAGVVGLASVAYSAAMQEDDRPWGYYPLVQVLLAGVCGAALTGDLFNLFVWFEVMLIASFVLLARGGRRDEVEGAIKYVAITLVGSAFFLSAAGLAYGLTGTLNLADLAVRLRDLPADAPVGAVAMLLLGAFGIKAAVFPLFFWLPPSYAPLPPALGALFAGLLTKVGVYALWRIFPLLFPQEPPYAAPLFLWIGIATMVVGVLGALAQNESRRILSFHIVSQIGYMVLGLGLTTPLARAGAVFFLLHNILAKSNLFLVAGLVRRAAGSFELARLGGLSALRPALAVLFLVPALALAGLPPLSGFFAKLALLRAAFAEAAYVAAAAVLAVSVGTLLSMMKIWNGTFWGEPPRAADPPAPRTAYAPAAGLAALTVGLGLAGGPVLALALRVADDLADPRRYVAAVLGADAW